MLHEARRVTPLCNAKHYTLHFFSEGSRKTCVSTLTSFLGGRQPNDLIYGGMDNKWNGTDGATDKIKTKKITFEEQLQNAGPLWTTCFTCVKTF